MAARVIKWFNVFVVDGIEADQGHSEWRLIGKAFSTEYAFAREGFIQGFTDDHPCGVVGLRLDSIQAFKVEPVFDRRSTLGELMEEDFTGAAGKVTFEVKRQPLTKEEKLERMDDNHAKAMEAKHGGVGSVFGAVHEAGMAGAYTPKEGCDCGCNGKPLTLKEINKSMLQRQIDIGEQDVGDKD